MGTAVAAVMTILTVAGCAQRPASPAANGSTGANGTTATNGTAATSGSPAANGTPAKAAPTTSTTTRPTASCDASGPLPASGLTITAADNGKTLCVRAGTAILVLLRGTAGDQWTTIRSSSAVLAPRPDPRMMLQRWVTGAAFKAAHPGMAAITSARYPCRVPPPADPGSTTSTTSPPVHCGAIMGFRVTVQVT
jgi:hypothetical protein